MIGLQEISGGLARVGDTDASLSVCQEHSARLSQGHGVGVGDRCFFGPLIHQTSIAVLLPADGILLCLEQGFGLGPNDLGCNSVQGGIGIRTGERGTGWNLGATTDQKRGRQECPENVLTVEHNLPSSAPSAECAR